MNRTAADLAEGFYHSVADLQAAYDSKELEGKVIMRCEFVERSTVLNRFKVVDFDEIEDLDYSKFSCHEVVSAGPRKFFLDVDLDEQVSMDKLMKFVAYFRRIIPEAFASTHDWDYVVIEDQDMHLFISSPSTSKQVLTAKGFHLIVDRIMFTKVQDFAVLFNAVVDRHSKDHDMLALISPEFAKSKVLDPAATKKGFNLRMPQSSKLVNLSLERPKIHYPTDEQEAAGLTNPCYGILTQLYDSNNSHLVSYTMSQNEIDSVTPLEIDDKILADAVGRVLATEYGQNFTYRNALGSALFFNRQSSGQLHCAACDRAHENDNNLFVCGKGLTELGGTLTMFCRKAPKGKKKIQTLLPKSDYVFDLEACKSKKKTDAMALLKSQKALFKSEIDDMITAKQKEHIAKAAAVNGTISKAKLAELVAEDKRMALRNLEGSFAAAIDVFTTLQGQTDSDVSIEGLKQYLEDTISQPVDVGKYVGTFFRQYRTRIFTNIAEMVGFIFSNYWWSNDDGVNLRNAKGEFESWEGSGDGLCPFLIKHASIRVKSTESVVRFAGSEFWLIMAEYCFKNAPATVCMYQLSFDMPYVGQVSSLSDVEFNRYCGLTGQYDHRPIALALTAEQNADFAETFGDLVYENFADRNQIYADYLLNWLAHAMQKPHKKTGVMIVLSGDRGIGKSLLLEALHKLVPASELMTNRGVAEISAKFNSTLDGRSLYMIGEAVRSSQSKAEDLAALKALITEESAITVERKHKEQIKSPSSLNFMACTNYASAIEIEDGDRRICVMPNPRPGYGQQDREYWKRVAPMMKSKEFVAWLQRYLLTRDISDFDPAEFPRHEIRNTLIDRNPVTQFILSTPNFAEKLDASLITNDSDGWLVKNIATVEAIVRLYNDTHNVSSNQLNGQIRTLVREMNENETLKSKWSLVPCDEFGISKHRVEKQGPAGKVDIIERDYSYACSQRVEITRQSEVEQLRAELARLKQLISASTVNTSADFDELKQRMTCPEQKKPAAMTVAELRAYLKSKGIAFNIRDTKTQLLTLIR